ncbi:CPBP family intramembrane glutamic endopeptidase [Blastococcus xanthinilyticus]|uniref:CAAX prenyl protease-like protein n=1 Tax=Blastococcus xanthinilyticus TaxID=1564164 RepID=A0A5S5D1F8_9ACTN|nr:CPBP family intramembrane glutamic endopeptidase [Blastococcus xanthinilyticus]TYP88946.1 CAAX prenyl protease-like protein [Blastococcus xanthinilyticus]
MLLLAVVLVLVLAVWNNVVVTRLPGYPASYVPGNAVATVLVLVAARGAGLSWAELGLARGRLGAGLRWGVVCAGLVAAGCAVGVAVPALRPLLADARAAGTGAGALAVELLVRIPVGTVLWEEVAFRGVLLAALARLLPRPRAVWGSAAVFGVWHIRPTLSAAAANDLTGSGPGTVLVVAAGCLVTVVAGALFAWLRLRSGSLLAPVLVHLATNTLGLLAAAAAHRLAAG